MPFGGPLAGFAGGETVARVGMVRLVGQRGFVFLNGHGPDPGTFGGQAPGEGGRRLLPAPKRVPQFRGVPVSPVEGEKVVQQPGRLFVMAETQFSLALGVKAGQGRRTGCLLDRLTGRRPQLPAGWRLEDEEGRVVAAQVQHGGHPLQGALSGAPNGDPPDSHRFADAAVVGDSGVEAAGERNGRQVAHRELHRHRGRHTAAYEGRGGAGEERLRAGLT
jgi:hypothetical protein